MDTMTTVSEVLNKLKKEGYTVDFNLNNNCLICHGNSLQIYPDEFVVDRHFRFEGISDPADEAVVYAISSAKHNVKGALVNGYGIYSEEMADDMIKALKENDQSAAQNIPPPAKEKFNKATLQRPEGDRPLDAPMVVMDLTVFKEQIKQESSWKDSDRNAITIFKTDNMRMVLIALHQGAEMKKHTAEGIINVQVLEGQIAFHTKEESVTLVEGQMLTLHAGIPHRVYAQRESVFLLTLIPLGEKLD
ncbi:MAG: cupin domain-containing protein [Fulvivirga sp.]